MPIRAETFRVKEHFGSERRPRGETASRLRASVVDAEAGRLQYFVAPGAAVGVENRGRKFALKN
jgi:hypothetical protein